MKTDIKRNLLFFARATCFFVILALVLMYAVYVLTPKDEYGICSIMSLYEREDNTIDVLCVGSSLVYADINTNILWADYGIAAYDLSSAEQTYWISYYNIKEALKTQRPKLILLDAKAATYTLDYSKRGRTILSTYGIKGLDNRIGATFACVETAESAVDFLLAFGQIHSNYQRLTLNDFVFPPDNGGRGDNWNGFIEVDISESHERPSLVWTSTRQAMNSREEEYVRKIFELCRDEGIEIMLVGMPNPDYAYDHMYYNYLWSVASEYGVTGINYNNPDLRFGLRYTSDFADWQHLNVKGSVKFSKKLGADLIELYGLEDRRGNARYSAWDECLAKWLDSVPGFETKGDILSEYGQYGGEGL